MHIGFESITLKKLHSFLVAAEAACSKGDLPVAAVEARLVAVTGLATAAVAAAVPAVLAAAVPVLLNATNGAAQPHKKQALKTYKLSIEAVLRLDSTEKIKAE